MSRVSQEILKRVELATQFNQQQKKEVGECALCQIKVSKIGSHGFDWDHLDQAVKSGNIGTITMEGASLKTIRQEITKCRLLCVYCHLDWTSRQLGYCDPLPKIKEALRMAQIMAFNAEELDLTED